MLSVKVRSENQNFLHLLKKIGLFSDKSELVSLSSYLEYHVERAGSILVRQLKRRDALRRQQDAHSDVISSQLLKREYQNQYE